VPRGAQAGENVVIGPTPIAWALAASGSACAVLAAYLQGGHVAALGAASTALLGAATVVGWKSNATPAQSAK
jgi:hypothetical protein